MILKTKRTERRNYGNINIAFCSRSDSLYQRFSDCSRPSTTVRETVFIFLLQVRGEKGVLNFLILYEICLCGIIVTQCPPIKVRRIRGLPTSHLKKIVSTPNAANE